MNECCGPPLRDGPLLWLEMENEGRAQSQWMAWLAAPSQGRTNVVHASLGFSVLNPKPLNAGLRAWAPLGGGGRHRVGSASRTAGTRHAGTQSALRRRRGEPAAAWILRWLRPRARRRPEPSRPAAARRLRAHLRVLGAASKPWRCDGNRHLL